MKFKQYAHRYADIILNSDYDLKKEVDHILESVSYEKVLQSFIETNGKRSSEKKKPMQGKQRILNEYFRTGFLSSGWDEEKKVFGGEGENDLRIDFWKRSVGVDVAFNHRSFIGGDLLRFQAAAEVANIMKLGIYICARKSFLKELSPKDYNSLVSFERTQWYLENFSPVLTVPVLLIGIEK